MRGMGQPWRTPEIGPPKQALFWDPLLDPGPEPGLGNEPILGPILRPFWAITHGYGKRGFQPLSSILDPFLRPFWAHLGPSGGPSGGPWGPSWDPILGPFWGQIPCESPMYWACTAQDRAPRRPPRRALGALPRALAGPIWAQPGASLNEDIWGFGVLSLAGEGPDGPSPGLGWA